MVGTGRIDGAASELRRPSSDIGDLLEGLRRGEAGAQRTLYRRYWGPPYRAALAVLKRQPDAYDITAGLMLDFMTRDVHRFQASTQGALIRFLRVAGRRRALTLVDEHKRWVPEAQSEAAAERSEPWLMRQLQRCLQLLPPRTRTILRLKYGGGQDNAEIGRVLGQTRANVSKLLIHPQKGALGRLRRCLNKRESAGTGGAEDDT